jgi:hypothetical protein
MLPGDTFLIRCATGRRTPWPLRLVRRRSCTSNLAVLVAFGCYCLADVSTCRVGRFPRARSLPSRPRGSISLSSSSPSKTPARNAQYPKLRDHVSRHRFTAPRACTHARASRPSGSRCTGHAVQAAALAVRVSTQRTPHGTRYLPSQHSHSSCGHHASCCICVLLVGCSESSLSWVVHLARCRLRIVGRVLHHVLQHEITLHVSTRPVTV